ncbi:hypothetical protein DLM75_17525 [Leptospira stimsonii]|uniref:Uncharacterized protein n=1 Tax=Leptospira stimsonii TaxID=2202203 RepID=A0A396Z298_9LEPT|nr:hypothetical protein DLM75_17525 [Leptospira stimsonii]
MTEVSLFQGLGTIFYKGSDPIETFRPLILLFHLQFLFLFWTPFYHLHSSYPNSTAISHAVSGTDRKFGRFVFLSDVDIRIHSL